MLHRLSESLLNSRSAERIEAPDELISFEASVRVVSLLFEKDFDVPPQALAPRTAQETFSNLMQSVIRTSNVLYDEQLPAAARV